MTKAVRGYVRDPNSGAGISGVTVSLKRHNGGTLVTSDATDTDGLFEMDRDAVTYAGPTYLQFVKDSTTEVSSGNVVGQIAGLLWGADIPDVLALLGIGVAPGVGSELAVTANGSSMAPAVAAGMALLKDGMPYVREAAGNAPACATADATNPRIDRVVLRLTREGQTDQGKIALTTITGTPAASPASPALTQTSATWDFPLARILIGAGVSTIAADKVTDERTYCLSYPTAISPGDLFCVDANGKFARLAKGTTGQYLKQGATVPGWDSLTVDDIDGTVSATELGYLDGVTSSIQTQINAKAALSHTHAEGDVTGLAADLAAKAAAVHAHAATDITSGTLPVSRGGTGGTTAATARTALGAQAADATLDAVAAFDATPGILVQTGADTFAKRTLVEGIGITIVNPAGTTGDITILKTDVKTEVAEDSYDAVAGGTKGVTSTGGGQIASHALASITLPNNGIKYDLSAEGGATLNAPPSGGTYLKIAMAIDPGTGTYTPGSYIGTGTVAGERWYGVASHVANIIAAGQTIQARLYAKVDGGTGLVGSGYVQLRAIPRV